MADQKDCHVHIFDLVLYLVEKLDDRRLWYDPAVLEQVLPVNYDLILIDGPHSKHGRAGFLHYLELFNTSVPMVFDDVSRQQERMLIEAVAQAVGRPWALISDKTAGVIGGVDA